MVSNLSKVLFLWSKMAFHGRKWGFGDGDSSEPRFHTLTNPENQNSNFKKPRWVETRQENIEKFQND